MRPPFAVLNLIDQLLWMLHAQSYGKGLRCNSDPSIMEIRVSVIGVLPRSQYNAFSLYFLLTVYNNASHSAGADQKVGNPGPESYLATKCQEFFPEILHHLAQYVRTNMGFRIDQNVRRGPEFHQGFPY